MNPAERVTRPGIAVAQTCPRAGDVRANITDHIGFARAAAAAHARIIVFPELSLTGYELGVARQLAFSTDDLRLTPLIDVAADEHITIVAGAPVVLNERLHIGAFIIAPDRSPRLYTKHHLGAFSDAASRDGTVPPPERTVFEPGSLDPAIPIGDDTAAIAICADVGHPAHPQRAARRGATIYLAGMFVIRSELNDDVQRLRSYAAQHRMLVAFANYACASGGLAAAGRSAIWDETGRLIAQLGDAECGVAIATMTNEGWQGSTCTMQRPQLRDDAF